MIETESGYKNENDEHEIWLMIMESRRDEMRQLILSSIYNDFYKSDIEKNQQTVTSLIKNLFNPNPTTPAPPPPHQPSPVEPTGIEIVPLSGGNDDVSNKVRAIIQHSLSQLPVKQFNTHYNSLTLFLRFNSIYIEDIEISNIANYLAHFEVSTGLAVSNKTKQTLIANFTRFIKRYIDKINKFVSKNKEIHIPLTSIIYRQAQEQFEFADLDYQNIKNELNNEIAHLNRVRENIIKLRDDRTDGDDRDIRLSSILNEVNDKIELYSIEVDKALTRKNIAAETLKKEQKESQNLSNPQNNPYNIAKKHLQKYNDEREHKLITPLIYLHYINTVVSKYAEVNKIIPTALGVPSIFKPYYMYIDRYAISLEHNNDVRFNPMPLIADNENNDNENAVLENIRKLYNATIIPNFECFDTPEDIISNMGNKQAVIIRYLLNANRDDATVATFFQHIQGISPFGLDQIGTVCCMCNDSIDNKKHIIMTPIREDTYMPTCPGCAASDGESKKTDYTLFLNTYYGWARLKPRNTEETEDIKEVLLCKTLEGFIIEMEDIQSIKDVWKNPNDNIVVQGGGDVSKIALMIGCAAITVFSAIFSA